MEFILYLKEYVKVYIKEKQFTKYIIIKTDLDLKSLCKLLIYHININVRKI